jgi:hypothetical protein
MIETNPVLQKHPQIQQYVASKVKNKPYFKAKDFVDQAVHDVRTGAMVEKEDEEGDSSIGFYPSKRETIDDIEPDPAAAREEITELCERLYKLITGIDLDMGDPDRAEKQVTQSQQVRNNIREICTYQLGKRDKRVLQDAVLPTLKALDKLADEIEATEK